MDQIAGEGRRIPGLRRLAVVDPIDELRSDPTRERQHRVFGRIVHDPVRGGAELIGAEGDDVTAASMCRQGLGDDERLGALRAHTLDRKHESGRHGHGEQGHPTPGIEQRGRAQCDNQQKGQKDHGRVARGEGARGQQASGDSCEEGADDHEGHAAGPGPGVEVQLDDASGAADPEERQGGQGEVDQAEGATLVGAQGRH
jgi:hypothetical protein